MMHYRTFAEYVFHRDEGLWVPNQPIVARIGKTNPLPITQAHRDRLTPKPVKAPPQGKPIPSPISQHLKAINRVFG